MEDNGDRWAKVKIALSHCDPLTETLNIFGLEFRARITRGF